MTEVSRARSVEILEGGIQTTVQDYPGRQGMLARGFFPAGPMDLVAHRAALVRSRTAGRNRVHAILARTLTVPPAGELFGARGRRWLALGQSREPSRPARHTVRPEGAVRRGPHLRSTRCPQRA